MYDPAEDGVSHINIYSRGNTELGRFLSHFTLAPFTLQDHGYFKCVEGYWYWLSYRDDRFRNLVGFSAKKLGKELAKNHEGRVLPDFRQRIYNANWMKLHTYPQMMNVFLASTLPFAHYYVFNGTVRDAGYGWIVEMWEIFRNTLKQRG